MALQLKSVEETRYDAIALGEILMRIDPGQVPTARARSGRIWHGGGETNVAEGLSYCFGLRAAVLTALVDDGIGRNIENQLREAGLDTSHIIWFNNSGKGKYSTDAKGTLHNGINFTWAGKGLLPSVTEYYRAHTPVREVGPGDIDWDHLFGELGTRWFSTGGIYTLLSQKTADLALEGMKKAGEHGVVRSFDLNYRSKVEPSKDRAREINKGIVPHVEFLVGNQDDFDDALGYETEKVPKGASFDVWLKIYTKMLHQVANDYPNLKYIGTQLRGALTADRINWGAVLFDVEEGVIHQAAVRENIEIADRTGGGDSFASGVAAALMEGLGADDAVQWGAAHGIMVQDCIGDTTMVTRADVEKEVARAVKGGGVSALR
ncbi:MAG TPA: sugar kinase [Candidatus Latescibacteria bacterium]|nr:sugar kinase [Candidatus Handelsmanbacteria bacterium]HIL10025.1 sugar kinase [Candidatus Latescibacterota bacterium]